MMSYVSPNLVGERLQRVSSVFSDINKCPITKRAFIADKILYLENF